MARLAGMAATIPNATDLLRNPAHADRVFWPSAQRGSGHRIRRSRWHLDVLCDLLADVTEGRRNRLINVPPGTMKSLLISVFWPAWEWASAWSSGPDPLLQ